MADSIRTNTRDRYPLNRGSAIVTIVIATLASSCLKGPGFLQQGEDQAATTLVSTQNDQGDVNGTVKAAMLSDQKILAASDSGIYGAWAMFPPGSLSIDTSVVVGLGADAASPDVLASLGLSPQSVSTMSSSVYIGTADMSDLAAPMTLSIPIGSGAGLTSFNLEDETENYAVTFIGTKRLTGETFTGFVPGRELTFQDNTVSFETRLWGSYQVIKLDDPTELENRPDQRVTQTANNIQPVLNTTIRDNAKMVIVSRTPFVVTPGTSVTLTGQHLTQITATVAGFGGGNNALRLDTVESNTGTSLIVKIPAAADLKNRLGRDTGFLNIALRKERSNTLATNVFIAGTTPGEPTIVATTASHDRVCAREDFFNTAGELKTGSGSVACSGEASTESPCADGFNLNAATTTTNCQIPSTGTNLAATKRAQLDPTVIKRDVPIAGVTGAGVTGEFPSADNQLPAPANRSPIQQLIGAGSSEIVYTAKGQKVELSGIGSIGPVVAASMESPVYATTSAYYKPFLIEKIPGLSADKIKSGAIGYGIAGTFESRERFDPSNLTDTFTGRTWSIVTQGTDCTSGIADLKMAYFLGLSTHHFIDLPSFPLGIADHFGKVFKFQQQAGDNYTVEVESEAPDNKMCVSEYTPPGGG